jgi:hypothetical protein
MAGLPAHLVAYVDQLLAGLKQQQTWEFFRLAENLVSVQVCTSLSDEDATARMNLTPSGTKGGWQLTDDPNNGPVPCADEPATHRHLIFVC